MNITIRTTSKNDKEAFLALMDEFYHTSAVLHPIPKENMEKCFSDSIKYSEHIRTYLFEDNCLAIGFAIVTIGYSSEAGGLSVWIEDVYLRESYRGMGLGSKFITSIENEFKGKAKRLRLEVEEDNEKAIRLYQKQGFEFLPYMQMIKDI